MIYLNFRWVRKAVMYTLYIIITTAFISNIAMAYDKVDIQNIQKKVSKSSFSKISHKAGLEQAYERFAYIIQKSEYKNKDKAWIEIFSKDLSSTETSSFIDAMVKQFNNDHDMRKSFFVLADKYIDSAGNLHIIMSQRINNIKVDAGKVVLHFNKDGDLYDISGQIQNDLAFQTIPLISGDEAVTAGEKVIESKSELYGSPELLIIGGKLSYKVILSEQDIPGYWKVIINAQSGEVLEKSSSLRFLNPPGWPDNGYYTPITGNIYTHEGGFSVTVNGWYDNSTNLYYLFNDDEDWQILYKFQGNEYLYSYTEADWGNTNPQAMSLAYNFGHIVSFVKNTMNRDCYDDAGAMALVRYWDIEAGNGFWHNPYFDLYKGYTEDDRTIYDFVVLDAVAHEYGHALTEYSSNLGIRGEPGALNEGYSDIFAMCVEEAFQQDCRDQYLLDQQHSIEATFDWLMSEDICSIGGQRSWFRNIREPWIGGLEGNEPSLYKGTYWQDESHSDSMPLSFAFYLISEGVGVESINDSNFQHKYGPFPGIGINKAREIAWGSQFNGRIPDYADYRIARNAWIATAQDLKYDAGVVAQAFTSIGVIDRTVGRPVGTTLPTNPPNYTTISDAINDAQTGDLIYVYPGTYVENLRISNRPGITIVSRNRDLTTIDGTVFIGGEAHRTTLTGFTIDADPSTIGVVVNGSFTQPMYGVTISGNTIRNCNEAVQLICATNNTIINNKFQSRDGGSVVLYNSTYTYILENKIDSSGIFFAGFNTNNFAMYNRFNSVNTDGIRFSLTDSSNTYIEKNDFVAINGSDIISWVSLTGFSCFSNVFSNQNGLILNIPLCTGIVCNNTISPNSYSIATPTTLDFNNNYWSDYLGQDTDGDGLGDTDVPHANVDYAPLMKPKVRAINFKYNDSLLMSSTVMDGKFRVAGTAGSGTAGGLKFGANSSLTTSGNLIGSQIFINSGKWLDQVSNLTGGLVFYDAEGKVQMHISTNGIVRIRNNLLLGF